MHIVTIKIFDQLTAIYEKTVVIEPSLISHDL